MPTIEEKNEMTKAASGGSQSQVSTPEVGKKTVVTGQGTRNVA